MNQTKTTFPTIAGTQNTVGLAQTKSGFFNKAGFSSRTDGPSTNRESLIGEVVAETKNSPVASKLLRSLKKPDATAFMSRHLIRLPGIQKTEPAAANSEEIKFTTIEMRGAQTATNDATTSLVSKLKLSVAKKVGDSLLPLSAAKLRAYSIQRGTFDASNPKKLSYSVDVSDKNSIMIKRKATIGGFFDNPTKPASQVMQGTVSGTQTARTGNSPVRSAAVYDTGKKYPTTSTLDDERTNPIDWSAGQGVETHTGESNPEGKAALRRNVSIAFSGRDSPSPPQNRALASPQKRVIQVRREEYFVHRVRTLGVRLRTGRQNIEDLTSNLRELHQYLEVNHRNLHLIKNDPIVWRPDPLILPRKYPNKKLLVLDLDETLIHCTGDMKRRHEFEVEVEFINDDGYTLKGLVNVRPGAKRFLQNASRDYELVLFTASVKYYADRILRIIDPTRAYFSHYFYRESCTKTKSDRLVKDLSMFKNVPEDEIMLVDNTMYCGLLQPNSLIPIVDFETNKDDKELDKLNSFLFSLRDHPDHQAVLKDHLKLHMLRAAGTLQDYILHL